MTGRKIKRVLGRAFASFGDLTRFECMLWTVSMLVVAASYLFSPQNDVLSLVASLLGVTALIFVAKGYVLGQVLIVVFAMLYGVVSYHQHYYGEVITYLGMTAPIAIAAVISWLRHPFEGTSEVEVNTLNIRQWVQVMLLTMVVSAMFYFLLRWLGTSRLWVSTLSVATSFFAAYLTFLRSPYYGLGYGANDVVLIVLWLCSSFDDPSYLPMVACFVMFLANDIYGFINWQRMRRRQQAKLVRS